MFGSVQGGLWKADRNLPVSFSAMGLNSSGLRYRSLLVSREENRNSPSFPKDFRASSCFGNKRQVRFWWNLLHQSTLESIPIPASTSRGKTDTPWQDLVLFAMSRTAGTRTLNLHLPEQFQLNICSRSVSFARKIPIFSSQLVLNLQTLGAPGGGDCHELMCRETKAARHVRTMFQKHKGTELSPWNWNFHLWWDPQQHPHPPNLQPQNHMEYFGSQLPSAIHEGITEATILSRNFHSFSVPQFLPLQSPLRAQQGDASSPRRALDASRHFHSTV